MLSKYGYIILTALLSATLFCSSCKEQIDHKGKTPLLSVDNEFVYKEDVARFYVANLPVSDSAAFVRNYVCSILEDILLLKVASRNIPEDKDIARLVDDYKKSLILNIYQDKLIEQQLRREIPATEVTTFYERNKELFMHEEPMMQGLYLKISKSASNISSVRKWVRGVTPDDLENLEKYTLTNAIVYDYFVDNWRKLESVAARMPITADDLLSRLKKDNVVEFSDTAAIYFVNATNLVVKGEQKTLDMAYGEIEDLLLNSMKVNFINEVKYDLLKQALESGDVKIYDKKYSALFDELAEQENK